jgi:hypothetical protein
VLRGERHQVAQHCLSLFLCDVMAISQLGGEMLERDGSLGRSLRRDCLRGAAAFLAAGAAFFAGGMTISFMGLFGATCPVGSNSSNVTVSVPSSQSSRRPSEHRGAMICGSAVDQMVPRWTAHWISTLLAQPCQRVTVIIEYRV